MALGLGLYYMYEGDYTQAERHFQASLDGYKDLNIEKSVANQYGNLALAILSAPGLSEFGVEALAGFGPVLPRFTRLKPLLRPFESILETWAIH